MPDRAIALYLISRVYNIGNNNPVNLMDYIGALAEALGKNWIG
jgi:UDP-glucuronate 4-epimerase